MTKDITDAKARIIAKATVVLGSTAAAERWLSEPALGLEQRRPIDVLETASGAELVETLLGQMKHCVYI